MIRKRDSERRVPKRPQKMLKNGNNDMEAH
jgi:hypothetical protein